MLNLLWGAMMLIGILYGAVTGRLAEVTDAALSCAKEAVALCITMSGIVAMEYISANVIANFLGLGWGATPLGLKAMEELAKLEEERKGKKPKSASNEMCTFLILNISSLQLIPVNVIAYRSQYGSANPAGVTGPAIVATFVSTLVAILFCKWMDR